MEPKDAILANLIVVLGFLFATFMGFAWSSAVGIFFCLLAFGVLYWRVKIFQHTGFELIKYLAIGIGKYASLGAVAGVVVSVICDFVFHMQMHHGFAFVLVGGFVLSGLFAGILVGYRKYKQLTL